MEKTKHINKYEDRKAYFKAAVADANRLQLYRSVYDKLIKKDSIRAITLDPRNITSNPLTDKGCIVAEEADSHQQRDAADTCTHHASQNEVMRIVRAIEVFPFKLFAILIACIICPKFHDNIEVMNW